MSQPFVRADVRAFLDLLAASPAPRMSEMSAAEARAVQHKTKDITDLPIGEIAVDTEITLPGPAGPLAARLFDARATRAPGPLLVFFHGGGWVIGDIAIYASICAEIARALDLPVLSIDYRLAPESPWPAAPDDCEAAARWAAASPELLGRSVTSLVLAGDSAGGNLAIVTALALRDAPAAVPVIAQIPIYPATDASRNYPSAAMFSDGYLLDRPMLRWFDAKYAADPRHLRMSPLLADLTGLPPAVVVTASLDPIRDQGRAYAAALAQVGVPVVFREAIGNIHGFINIRRAIPSSVADTAAMLDAARSVIAEAEAARIAGEASA